ncbi:hypothetical protein POPTR_006G179600v4 [Populus trichocarpa]|uniref:Uncharacterized protein n=1 Tax=Populus trichocarpa TaxID=3694 RepID=A0ACC0SUX9_POPTR|nr:hypothetical protein BDE02_06G155300 [Populus trichocarpa]KAI9393072.1 hypothetical protein POPTR_006G179600v4 [Populus trichocarpa]
MHMHKLLFHVSFQMPPAFGACKSFGFTRGFLSLGSDEGAEDEKNPQEEGKTGELVCLCILSRWATWCKLRIFVIIQG